MEDTSSLEVSIPPDILQPFLMLTNTSSLQEALEILIETAKTETGRSKLVSMDVVLLVLDLTKFLSSLSTNCDLLLSTLKLLRNLCAGENRNQNTFIAESGVEVIWVAMTSVGFGSDSDNRFLRTGLQVLGNVALGGKEHQRAIWEWLFSNRFMDIAQIRSVEICDPLCMIIYTCCNGSKELLMELCEAQGLTLVAEIVKTASTVGFGEEWFKWLISRICVEESYFPSLYRQLNSGDTTVTHDYSKDHIFTAEQVFLLSVVSEWLNQQASEVSVSIEFTLYVLEILNKALKVVDFFSTDKKSGLPTGIPEIDVLGYSITILRDVCALDSSGSLKTGGVNIDSLQSLGFLEQLLDILRELELPEIIRKTVSHDKDQERSGVTRKLKVCPYKGFRRDIVAVIGNCLYRRKTAQDEVRKRNGIILLLQQCVTDEDNPFLREWGIWSVRNLLEDNEENQREVTELELQGSVNVPQIAGLGLRVDIDPRTGRPKLVNDQ